MFKTVRRRRDVVPVLVALGLAGVLLSGCAPQPSNETANVDRSGQTSAPGTASNSTSTSWITCQPVNLLCPAGSSVRVQSYDVSLTANKVTVNEDMTPFGETADQKEGLRVNSTEDVTVVFTFTNHGDTAFPVDGIGSAINMQSHNPNLSGDGLNQACPVYTGYSGVDNGVPLYDGGLTRHPLVQPGQSEQIEVDFGCTIGTTDLTIGGVGPGMLKLQ